MSKSLGDPRLPLRFWSKVELDPGSDCWLWLAARNDKNYGNFAVTAKTTRGAHRVAYLALVGAIPGGLVLDHLCRNPPCVNPSHLEPVTHRVNILRGLAPAAQNAVATRCVNGHAFTPSNTYIAPKSAMRFCRACGRRRTREYEASDAGRAKRRARERAVSDAARDRRNERKRAKRAAQRSSNLPVPTQVPGATPREKAQV